MTRESVQLEPRRKWLGIGVGCLLASACSSPWTATHTLVLDPSDRGKVEPYAHRATLASEADADGGWTLAARAKTECRTLRQGHFHAGEYREELPLMKKLGWFVLADAAGVGLIAFGAEGDYEGSTATAMIVGGSVILAAGIGQLFFGPNVTFAANEKKEKTQYAFWDGPASVCDDESYVPPVEAFLSADPFDVAIATSGNAGGAFRIDASAREDADLLALTCNEPVRIVARLKAQTFAEELLLPREEFARTLAMTLAIEPGEHTKMVKKDGFHKELRKSALVRKGVYDSNLIQSQALQIVALAAMKERRDAVEASSLASQEERVLYTAQRPPPAEKRKALIARLDGEATPAVEKARACVLETKSNCEGGDVNACKRLNEMFGPASKTEESEAPDAASGE